MSSDLFAEARDFVEAYRMARAYIGADAQPLIEAEDDLVEVEADELKGMPPRFIR